MFSERKQLNMKKILMICALAVTLVVPASAATFTAGSFLNAQMLYLEDDSDAGDTSTNSFTNLVIAARINGLAGYSNAIGGIFTNNVGVSNKVAAGSGETFNCLGSVQLWPKADGTWQKPTWAMTTGGIVANASTYGQTNQFSQEAIQTANFDTDCSLLVEVTGIAGWDGNVTLVFYPGYRDPVTREDVVVTAGAAPWSITLTHAALTGLSCMTTNVPTYKWPGAERLYLYTITNDDTTAGDDVAVSRVDLIGWKP